MLFLAWRYGGDDPYRTYNGLGEDYRPLGHPELPAHPPRYPTRLRHFVYGCGLFAAEHDAKLAGAKTATSVARAM